MCAIMMRSLLLLLPCISALVYFDYNGFRYQLANTAVTETVDFTGDDCAASPCIAFAVPASCGISFVTTDLPVVAQAKNWGTSFLAAVDGFYAVTNWMLSPGSFSIVDASSNPGSVALNDAGWQARIIMQCRIPCEAGSILLGSTCIPCSVGRWSFAGSTVCQACTNGPTGSVYTSVGVSTSNCSFICGAGSYTQPLPSPHLLIGDQYSIEGGPVVYSPRSSEITFGRSFMVYASPTIVYTGTAAVNRVDLSNGTYITVAGSSSRGTLDGIGTAAAFNSIVGGGLWLNYMLALDGMNCNLRQIDLATRTVVTVLGGACGFAEGTGLAARIRYPTDIVISQDVAYIADAGNYRIRAVALTTMSTTTLVGNGVGGNTDGVGTAASVDPRYLALSADQTILFVKTVSLVRLIRLSSGQISTVPASLGSSPYQIAASTLNPNIVYFATSLSVSMLFVSSGQVSQLPFHAGFISLVNETLAGTMCVACTVCSVGQFGVCNSSASVCVPCPLGQSSVSPGATSCVPCAAGRYGLSTGVCVACPIGSYSAPGATACINCSAGMFLSAGICRSCGGGTYSIGGTTSCLACSNLIGNATYSADPGTNSTSCSFVCRPGFNYVQVYGVCSPCAIGQWSLAGATVCSDCLVLPDNATFSGVGTNATNCPFACDAGFRRAAGCIPCPAGTRMLAGACISCPAASFSSAAATVCAACTSGYYSLVAASACTSCPNQSPYSIFIGRSTSSNCPFYCAAGAYMFRSTACLPCVNGTYSVTGSTVCANCSTGTWSNAASTACIACSSLQLTAFVNGTGLIDFPYVSKAGWAVSSVTCIQ